MNDRKHPKSPEGPPPRRPKGPALDPQIQRVIGQQLRRMHDEVVKEGIPDRFAELLKRLDKRDR
ncbi:MAG TPA: NepR family anti-sigma factor [Steroidobacteraceae bacterium]